VPHDTAPEPDPLDGPAPAATEDSDPAVREALRALLAPTEDLRSVAMAGVDRRLRGSSLMSTLSDLSSVGWETVHHLLTNPPPEADREQDCEVPMRERDP
jgi:hypothetical protein